MDRKINKRGIMGIGTLIIFIATILVAAVAAAVLISTSNVLQQRSNLVAQDARKGLTNGVTVLSILAESNISTEKFNNFEITLKLSPGSDSLKLQKVAVEYLSRELHSAGELLYPGENNNHTITTAVGTSAVSLGIDLDGDNQDENIILVDSPSGDYLIINLSKKGSSDPINFSSQIANGDTVTLEETPITIGETVYGSIEISGTASSDNEIAANSILIRKVASECAFKFLTPEKYFCFEPIIGDSDYYFENQERLKFYYKVKKANEPSLSEDIMFLIGSQDGRVNEVRARTPDVISFKSVRIWPLD